MAVIVAPIYLFGVWTEPFRRDGHYLYDRHGQQVDHDFLPVELRRRLDGQLCPVDPLQREGKARHHCVQQWTAIAFWDQTGDTRRNSNSAFLAPGVWSFEEMLDSARLAFPQIFKRFTFGIVEAA